jgi:elongation factor Ts
MSKITAAAVKSLRDKTSLPMMECKAALAETDGDEEAAIEMLRKKGKDTMEGRDDRTTSEGRMAVYCTDTAGALVEVQCESASVAGHDEFVQLANNLAQQLATGPGAATPDELLAQDSPSAAGKTIKEQMENLTNRTREVLRVPRIHRIDATCAAYAHHTGTVGVLLEVEGTVDADLARDICMHAAAMKPAVLAIKDLDADEVAKEREILAAAAREEGKPENIIEKMVDGRMRNYYAEQVLEEQPFVKDDKVTVGKAAEGAGMKLVRFVAWQLGEEG